MTPSGISTGITTGGAETPESIELRKRKMQEEGLHRLIVHKFPHCKPEIRQFGHTRLAVHRVARKTS